ncbi:retrovirus-related pol polyprotein from transposon TNT 1-94 [Tanacetum coccineum]
MLSLAITIFNWGSNATVIPSSSSLVMTGCLDCSLVSGLRMFKTHDRESLSAHELSSKTKSWLWHCRLSHLNFGTINKLTKDGLARGIPRLKFQKDHLCSACALGKSKRSSHQPKAEDTNQEKLYLLHMDLGGPMRVASINRKSVRGQDVASLALQGYTSPPLKLGSNKSKGYRYGVSVEVNTAYRAVCLECDQRLAIMMIS